MGQLLGANAERVVTAVDYRRFFLGSNGFLQNSRKLGPSGVSGTIIVEDGVVLANSIEATDGQCRLSQPEKLLAFAMKTYADETISRFPVPKDDYRIVGLFPDHNSELKNLPSLIQIGSEIPLALPPMGSVPMPHGSNSELTLLFTMPSAYNDECDKISSFKY